LAAVRARWFTTSGSARNTPAEDNARAIAIEVLRAGRISRRSAGGAVGLSLPAGERAIAYAERAGYITPTRMGLEPGETIPPGKLPKEVRALMLTRFAREAGRRVSSAEAAAAIGLTLGSFPRVVAFARAQGWVTTKNGPGGGIAASA